jgi:hypothetical protein
MKSRFAAGGGNYAWLAHYPFIPKNMTMPLTPLRVSRQGAVVVPVASFSARFRHFPPQKSVNSED